MKVKSVVLQIETDQYKKVMYELMQTIKRLFTGDYDVMSQETLTHVIRSACKFHYIAYMNPTCAADTALKNEVFLMRSISILYNEEADAAINNPAKDQETYYFGVDTLDLSYSGIQ